MAGGQFTLFPISLSSQIVLLENVRFHEEETANGMAARWPRGHM